MKNKRSKHALLNHKFGPKRRPCKKSRPPCGSAGGTGNLRSLSLFPFFSFLSLSPLSPLASFSLSLSLSFLLSSLLLLVSPSFLSLLPHPSLLSPPYRCSLALASLTLSLPSFLSLSPLSSLVFFCYVVQLLWDRKPQCRNGEGAPPRGRGGTLAPLFP